MVLYFITIFVLTQEEKYGTNHGRTNVHRS